MHVLDHHDPGLGRATRGELERRPDRGVKAGQVHRAGQRRRLLGRLFGELGGQPARHGRHVGGQPGRQAGAGRPGRAQQVRGQRERQAALAIVAPAVHDRGPALLGTGPERLDQRGFAAAWLADHGDHLPAGPRRHLRPGRGEHAEFLGAAGHRPRDAGGPPVRPGGRGPHPLCLSRPRASRPPPLWRRLQAARAHVVVEPRGLRQRPHGKLAVEHPDEFAVLADGGGALPGPGQNADQRLVGRFVQRVEGQPPAGVVECPGGLAGADATGDQPFERTGQHLAQPISRRRLPVLELRAVAQREPGEEVVPVEPRRALQGGQVRPDGQRLEVGHVHPHPVRPERHHGAGDREALSHGGRRDRERPAQRPPGAGGVGFRPEQGGEPVPALFTPRDREDGQQRDGLLGVETDDDGVPLHDRWPQERQAQLRHRAPPW